LLKEICKIKGFENIKEGYYICDNGYVIKSKNNSLKPIWGYIKKEDGYRYFSLPKKKNRSRTNQDIRANVLVAKAFLYNRYPEINKIVNHKMERTNNDYFCLEWQTHSYNSIYEKIKPCVGQIRMEM